MLNDGTGFKKVYLATGFTDLRRGIDGLARINSHKYLNFRLLFSGIHDCCPPSK